MNNARRRVLKETLVDLSKVLNTVNMAYNDEDDYLNCIPDSFESKIEDAEDMVSKLEDAISSIEDAIENIEYCVSN